MAWKRSAPWPSFKSILLQYPGPEVIPSNSFLYVDSIRACCSLQLTQSTTTAFPLDQSYALTPSKNMIQAMQRTSDMRLPPVLFLPVSLSHAFSNGMSVNTQASNRALLCLLQAHRLDEPAAYTEEGILWPAAVPINGGAAD